MSIYFKHDVRLDSVSIPVSAVVNASTHFMKFSILVQKLKNKTHVTEYCEFQQVIRVNLLLSLLSFVGIFHLKGVCQINTNIKCGCLSKAQGEIKLLMSPVENCARESQHESLPNLRHYRKFWQRKVIILLSDYSTSGSWTRDRFGVPQWGITVL